jgi:biopolymer transport protein TolQ
MFWSSRSINEAAARAVRFPNSPEAAVFLAGFEELRKINAARQTAGATLSSRLARMDTLKRALRKARSIELSRLERSLPFLATTGSATPFIGLFGTVWGIMTSFHDIGMRGSASLAVVAPGISEALVATAAGLAVAIPATIFFNFFSGQVAAFDTAMENFSADLLNLVERDQLAREGQSTEQSASAQTTVAGQ